MVRSDRATRWPMSGLHPCAPNSRIVAVKFALRDRELPEREDKFVLPRET